MTRVIYTPDIFSRQRTGGISRYVCELAKHIRQYGIVPRVVAGVHLNQHLRRIRPRTGCYVPRLGPIGDYRLELNQKICQWIAARSPDDIVHSTYYSDTTYPSSHPEVLTVHDMIEERFPDPLTEDLSATKRRHCQRADHIIVVSQSTKRDLIDIFGIPQNKITVIYHGDSLAPKHIPSPCPRSNYLLYVGNREGYKNFARFLEAFGSSTFLSENFRIVAFGGGCVLESESKLIERLGIEDSIQFVTGDDRILIDHYRRATALVFPSLLEGFGLPVLEAMGQGCPVICSDAGSLREVGGDAVEYFSPNDPADMHRVVEETLKQPPRLAELRERGYLRHSLFSWDKCAEQTASVYAQLTKKTVNA